LDSLPASRVVSEDPTRVPICDLATQHATMQTDIEAAALAVLRSGRYILGDCVEHFELVLAQYLGQPHAVGVGSGTDALLIALMACGIGPGDEVITTPFSFFASTAAIIRVGATPVFVDIDAHTLNIDTTRIAAATTNRTRGILPVHLFGRAVRVRNDGLSELPDVPVIHDMAQSIGAVLGDAWGDEEHTVGCLSFFPTKNLGAAGDGGAIVTASERVASTARLLRVQGSTQKYLALRI
jgi:dTDP-4-amino-4,6-dideoxygalactose transaminase